MTVKKVPPATKKEPAKEHLLVLTDSELPVQHRMMLLAQLCLEPSPSNKKIVASLLESAAKSAADPLAAKKLKEVNALLGDLKAGPLRLATFLSTMPSNGLPHGRVHVILENGDSAFPVAVDASSIAGLRAGDGVLLDAQGRSIVQPSAEAIRSGEEARFDRLIGSDRVEATLRDHDPFVFRLSDKLAGKIRDGKVPPGSRLLVCPRRAMAFDVVSAVKDSSRYRFLCQEGVPDVVVNRDIGAPPAFIDDLLEHLEAEMLSGGLRRKYALRRAATRFLCGVSGSGKTYAILGFWRAMYELMSRITGVPVADLPQRVFRLRMSEVLSKWLGESDKNLDRLFDEVQDLGDVTFTAPDGTTYELPVLVICEEIDALARTRGSGDPVYDRIQATSLERLDMNRRRLSSGLFVFLFTSNVPHLVDPAFVRRAGGVIDYFGRLSRRSFAAVLQKHVERVPLCPGLGQDPKSAVRRVVDDLSDWFFQPNGHDPGQVQLSYVGSQEPDTRYRRDFLTAALVDRAVQQAAVQACREERQGSDQPGVSREMLLSAFESQVRSICEMLTAHNAAEYLTLPEGVRVSGVRRIPQSSVQPFELQYPVHRSAVSDVVAFA